MSDIKQNSDSENLEPEGNPMTVNLELEVNADGGVDGEYQINHSVTEDDLVAELANLPSRESQLGRNTSIGRIRKVRHQRARTAHRFVPSAIEDTNLGKRWVRLVLLFVISISVLLMLFQYDQNTREEGVRNNLTSLLGIPTPEMYQNLQDEAFFWGCQPDSLSLGVAPAPASVKASHRAHASIMCTSKAFGLTFWQVVDSHKDVELPITALKRTFTYDHSLKRLKSIDKGAPMFIPPLPTPEPKAQPAAQGEENAKAAQPSDAAAPQPGDTVKKEGNPNSGDAAGNSDSAPTSPKGD